jgi:simple sugar transport system ATP-binding protein
MPRVIIDAAELSRDFGHVQALRDASLRVHEREVVALVGDNGAGKSTFMNILGGALAPDHGSLQILGAPAQFTSVRDAQAVGVESVYQNLSLAPDLTVPESIFLGHEVLSTRWRWLNVLDRDAMAEQSVKALKLLGIELPRLDVPIADLSGGQRQAVAVARAVKWAKSAILMDEPTAALGVRQTDIVTRVIRAAANSGLAVLVISHDMPRMLQTADRIVVMRHGRTVADLHATEVSIPDIVAEMLGISDVRRSFNGH